MSSRQEILTYVENQRRLLVDFVCIVIDLDGFRAVNDLLGEAGGDLVLSQVSERLSSVCEPWGAQIGWLGADQFLVVVHDDDLELDATKRLARVLEEAVRASPFSIFDRSLRLTASLGIGRDLGQRQTEKDLLRTARLAMYQAKTSPEAICVYVDGSERFGREEVSDPELAELLNVVLTQHGGSGLVLAYQPIIDLETLQTRGIEALVRWMHPERGLLAPGDFLLSAQTSRLSRELDGWVLRRALDDLVLLDELKLGPEFLTVNLTGSDLSYDGSSEEIFGEVERRSIEPSRLVVELTETDLSVNNIGEIAESLWELRDLGVRVALDDFGTGASSISHLDTFPADVLKIDKAMVLGVGGNKARLSLIRGLVALARNVGLEVIAEGVDSTELAAELASFGCSLGQGYFLGRPMPMSELVQALGTEKTFVEGQAGVEKLCER
jgi:diguanylate cyclase (GGDEF)-like protein